MTARKDANGPDYLASIRLLTRFLPDSRLLLGGALIAAVVGAFCELLPIWLLARTIDAAMRQGDAAGETTSTAIAILGAIAACFVANGLATGLGHLAAFRVILRMRIAIIDHMARIPLGMLDRYRGGDAKRLVLDDPEGLEGLFAHGLPDALGAFALCLAMSIWLFALDWMTALAAILPALCGLAALAIAIRRSAPLAMRFQAASLDMNAAIVEMLGAIPLLKVFPGGLGTRNARRAIDAHTRAETAMAVDYIPFGAVFSTLIAANVAFVLPIGLTRIGQGKLDPAGLLIAVIIGAAYSAPLLKLFAQFHRLASISLNSTLAADLLAIPVQVDSGARHDLSHHDVVFDHVSFAHEGKTVLNDISFTAAEGQMTALVGQSGAGKSTIANLVPRFFDGATGTITIGGIDVRRLSLTQLRAIVAVVPQIPFLFADTLLDNIRIGNPGASDEQAITAARAAGLDDLAARLPDGWQSRLGQGGVTPSGGERQRIAIARLLLKDAPIVILDEATAFSDTDNEAAVMQAIDALAKRRTVLVIAHRLQTVRRAAQILVVDQGRICERGRHEDLLARDGLYASLWKTSFEPQPSDIGRPTRPVKAGGLT